MLSEGPDTAWATVEAEPPIERLLLLSEAATLNQPPAPARPLVVSPLPPARQPAGFHFLTRRPTVSAPVVPRAACGHPPTEAAGSVRPGAGDPGASEVVQPVEPSIEPAPDGAMPLEAVPVLERVGTGTPFLDSRDAARLWGFVGLARQAIRDQELGTALDRTRALFDTLGKPRK